MSLSKTMNRIYDAQHKRIQKAKAKLAEERAKMEKAIFDLELKVDGLEQDLDYCAAKAYLAAETKRLAGNAAPDELEKEKALAA